MLNDKFTIISIVLLIVSFIVMIIFIKFNHENKNVSIIVTALLFVELIVQIAISKK